MTTLEKVKSLVADHLCIPADSIADDADIVRDLNADSIDLVEMVMTLEEEFGISVPDEKLSAIKTISDIVKLVEENKKK